MKRIVLPILLFAVLIWLVPLAGFLLAAPFRQCRRRRRQRAGFFVTGRRAAKQQQGLACSKAFCLRTTQGKTPF